MREGDGMDVRSGWRLMFLLPLAMAGCGGGGGGGHVMVRDSAGVVIVENAGPERDLGPTTVLVPDLTPADSGIMALPWGVAGDPGARRIYVIDRFQRRVVVFDGAGRRVGAFGRRGGGPGEFEDPSAIAMGDAGEVLVWDTGRGVLSRWSGDGRLLGGRTTGAVAILGTRLLGGARRAGNGDRAFERVADGPAADPGAR